MSALLQCQADEGFGRVLAALDGTLVVSTYQARKVALIGHDGQQITVLVRDMQQPMGLSSVGSRLAIALEDSVLVMADAPALAGDMPDAPRGKNEHLFLPRASYVTGDVRAHDVALGDEGLWIVNTRFSCLCLASDEHSFVPRWMPRFVSRCVPEDRCHLSGLAVERGAPAFATAHAATDAPGAWREHKVGGGVVVDVASGAPIAGGLSMPHSPRVTGDELWVLDSGRGELVRVDRASGALRRVARLPGFTRGLCFEGARAFVGLSRIRERDVFGGVPIAARAAELVCGVAIVDTRSGNVEGLLRFAAGCDEIFDVALLRGMRRVHLLDPTKPAARLALSTPDFAYWARGDEAR